MSDPILFVCPPSAGFVQRIQKDALNDRIHAPGDYYVDQIMAWGHLDVHQALVLLMAMESRAICVVYRDIFHTCTDLSPVALIRYREGLPSLPWICPECEQEVEDSNELAYEIFGRFRAGVRLE